MSGLRWAGRLLCLVVLWVCGMGRAPGTPPGLPLTPGRLAEEKTAAQAVVRLPQPNAAAPIKATAQAANRWRIGSYEVWILRGDCRIAQGGLSLIGSEAVLWIDRSAGEVQSAADNDIPSALAVSSASVPGFPTGEVLPAVPVLGDRPSAVMGYSGEVGRSGSGPTTVIVYLENGPEGAVQGVGPGARFQERVYFGRLYTAADVAVEALEIAGEPAELPPVFLRAAARRNAEADRTVRLAQYMSEMAPPGSAGAGDSSPPGGTRRIRVFPRSSVPVQAQWFPDPNGGRWIGLIDAGVNLIVEEAGPFGTVDISADRLVIWVSGDEQLNLADSEAVSSDLPLEVYMEGNIVFRQADRRIYADRMYYDVNRRAGIVLNGELLTPVPDYDGLLRLRADILQQLDENRFFAQNLFITSSRLGVPGYRLQAQSAFLEDFTEPVFDPVTGEPVIDPETGRQAVIHHRWATGRDNFVFLRNVPIFYWPVLAGDLTKPTYYLNRIRLRNDNVFGTQVLTNWDAYQLFGIRNRPDGTEWSISLDYLSDRGLGHGSGFTYARDGFLGLPGYATGLIDYWGVFDDGRDNLGLGRRALVPEKDYRYRFLWQHRQFLDEEYQLTGEVGLISDRNFLEQFYEREWDELKDQSTSLELKRIYGNASWSLAAGVRMNKFFTQTEWLPRFDHYRLGTSFLYDSLTWYTHTSLGFARLRTASTPQDPADAAAFAYLPWEVNPISGAPLGTNSERFVTRHEIDWPFQIGPVKIVPYALGELGHWGEDVYGEDYQRAYVQLGTRASLPVWSYNPYIESDLFNVHGIAHKVTLKAEAFWANSSDDMDRLPLYDPLDDDAVEAFRRRLSVLTFGPGTGFGGPPVPLPFDERTYALRGGMASWVTAPSMEIADDLTLIRLGVEQRWQTKRGQPGARRIIDWVTFDTHFSLFPDSSRDNFGRFVGLWDFDARWFLGDRLTLASGGVFDFFDSGQKLFTLGAYLNRPPRGDLYVGLRVLQGPIDSTVLFTSYSYRMSPKWMTTLGVSIDLGESNNIGQNFSLTRIGESFLVSAGVNVDAGRDSVGFNFTVEPRFLPKRRLMGAGGAAIPISGTEGLE
ncbi:MAG: organic solvent tolerance protein OstA [Thermogutta sp.]